MEELQEYWLRKSECQALIDHHEHNEAMAEARGYVESARWHRDRSTELKEILAKFG